MVDNTFGALRIEVMYLLKCLAFSSVDSPSPAVFKLWNFCKVSSAAYSLVGLPARPPFVIGLKLTTG